MVSWLGAGVAAFAVAVRLPDRKSGVVHQPPSSDELTTMLDAVPGWQNVEVPSNEGLFFGSSDTRPVVASVSRRLRCGDGTTARVAITSYASHPPMGAEAAALPVISGRGSRTRRRPVHSVAVISPGPRVARFHHGGLTVQVLGDGAQALADALARLVVDRWGRRPATLPGLGFTSFAVVSALVGRGVLCADGQTEAINVAFGGGLLVGLLAWLTGPVRIQAGRRSIAVGPARDSAAENAAVGAAVAVALAVVVHATRRTARHDS